MNGGEQTGIIEITYRDIVSYEIFVIKQATDCVMKDWYMYQKWAKYVLYLILQNLNGILK